MTDNGTMEIAGKWTVDDWTALESKLAEIPTLWDTAFDDFFMERLNTRYLDPIRLLQKHGNNQGEGFSIVSLQCALIEFLQTTRDGFNFCHNGQKKYPPTNGYYYKNGVSRVIFTSFLTEQDPFKKYFDVDAAESFFKNIRCSLLHEARTTKGWRITANTNRSKSIEEENGATYLQRDLFQHDLETYIWRYKIELLSDKQLQAAFIRKFNALCDLPIDGHKTDTE